MLMKERKTKWSSKIKYSGKRSDHSRSGLVKTLSHQAKLNKFEVRIDLRCGNHHKSNIQKSIMSFSFGFSGDDVGDDNDVVGQNDGAPAQAEAKSQFVGLPAEEHSLDDLVG
jgi:hypothetical protein